MDRKVNVVKIDGGPSRLLSRVVCAENHHNGRYWRAGDAIVQHLDAHCRLIGVTPRGKPGCGSKDVDPKVISPLGIQAHGAPGLVRTNIDACGVGGHCNHVVAADRDGKFVRPFNANTSSRSDLTVECSDLGAKITAVRSKAVRAVLTRGACRGSRPDVAIFAVRPVVGRSACIRATRSTTAAYAPLLLERQLNVAAVSVARLVELIEGSCLRQTRRFRV